MEDNKVQSMIFSAIDQVITQSIPVLTQDPYRGKDYVYYGQDNMYPEYLWNLVNEVSTLKTVIFSTADYVAGDDAYCTIPGFSKVMNRKGDTLRNIIRWCAKDFLTYGGFGLNIIRNAKNEVAEVNYVDFRYLRSDKKNECFWYSEDFSRRYARTSKALVYPKYIPDGDAPSSILYVKNDVGSTYPIPRYSGAIKAAEIERHIDNLHLNSLENGFMGSYLINFLNGVPDATLKEEIEKQVVSKFAGSQNAGRIILNFANGKDNAADIQKLDITDFGERYKAAAERARTTIYQAFGAQGQLFGDMSASTGFNEIEFKTSWALYNSTVVRNIQRVIGDAFDLIFKTVDSINIDPFTMGDQTDVN